MVRTVRGQRQRPNMCTTEGGPNVDGVSNEAAVIGWMWVAREGGARNTDTPGRRRPSGCAADGGATFLSAHVAPAADRPLCGQEAPATEENVCMAGHRLPPPPREPRRRLICAQPARWPVCRHTKCVETTRRRGRVYRRRGHEFASRCGITGGIRERRRGRGWRLGYCLRWRCKW